MTHLSINVNKVATLRNSRGGTEPNLLEAVEVCVKAGARSITVHPRADERHIRVKDVYSIAEFLRGEYPEVEFNIEGDPRPELIALVEEVKPEQCTLVPVRPGEITSEAGWPADTPKETMCGLIEGFQVFGIRVSVFVEAQIAAIDWAADLGADRVELYTEPYARAFEQGDAVLSASLEEYGRAIARARARGLGVNAGHDLNLENLPTLLKCGDIDEVSIGHALISRALYVGLDNVVREYLAITG